MKFTGERMLKITFDNGFIARDMIVGSDKEVKDKLLGRDIDISVYDEERGFPVMATVVSVEFIDNETASRGPYIGQRKEVSNKMALIKVTERRYKRRIRTFLRGHEGLKHIEIVLATTYWFLFIPICCRSRIITSNM